MTNTFLELIAELIKKIMTNTLLELVAAGSSLGIEVGSARTYKREY